VEMFEPEDNSPVQPFAFSQHLNTPPRQVVSFFLITLSECKSLLSICVHNGTYLTCQTTGICFPSASLIILPPTCSVEEIIHVTRLYLSREHPVDVPMAFCPILYHVLSRTYMQDGAPR
jgi:hypothetical protein